MHVGVRTGIGHGPFVGTACARRRFDNGKQTTTTTTTTTTNGGRETRNEVRTAKGYDAPLGRISYSRGIGGGTRTPRTEKTKSTVIRFGRGTPSGRGKYYRNARHNNNRVHAHGRPRTALVIRIRKIITTLENHTCPCVYMQYPFSNKFRSSNTPRTLTDYLP